MASLARCLLAAACLSLGHGETAPISRWRFEPFNKKQIYIRTMPRFDAVPLFSLTIQPGAVVSVSEERRVGDTTFLKLADGTGWIFDKTSKGVMCVREHSASEVPKTPSAKVPGLKVVVRPRSPTKAAAAAQPSKEHVKAAHLHTEKVDAKAKANVVGRPSSENVTIQATHPHAEKSSKNVTIQATHPHAEKEVNRANVTKVVVAKPSSKNATIQAPSTTPFLAGKRNRKNRPVVGDCVEVVSSSDDGARFVGLTGELTFEFSDVLPYLVEFPGGESWWFHTDEVVRGDGKACGNNTGAATPSA